MNDQPTPYEARVLADSVSDLGIRLVTLQVTFPRIVLAEFNTHRVFSRNSASSRAIPVKKRIRMVRENPYVPEAFGANKKGMQPGEKLDGPAAVESRDAWLNARDHACLAAERLAEIGVHKQWANRLLEPFAWHTVIVTATEWANFFALRDNGEAQGEIQKAARAMREAMDASTSILTRPGQWHLPLISNEDRADPDLGEEERVKVSVARCARVSYLTHEGVRDPSKDLELYHRLTSSGHMSPLEHVATPIPSSVFVGNFRGWVQHRKMIAGESVFGSAPVSELG